MVMDNIYEETYRLLQALDPSVSQLIEGTGLKERWLRKFINREFSDPGVNKVQKLYNYLRTLDAGVEEAA